MLKSVFVRSYRSCVDTELDELNEFTLLVGRNGAGKSNILKAMDWAARVATGRLRTDKKASWFHQVVGAVSITFTAGGSAYRYEADRAFEVLAETDVRRPSILIRERLVRLGSECATLVERDREQVTITASGKPAYVSISEGASAIPAILALLPSSNSLVSELSGVMDFLSSVVYYPLEVSPPNAGSYFVQAEALNAWKSTPDNSSASSESIALRILSLYRERPAEFQELKDLLGPDGLELLSDIDVFEIPHFGKSSEEVPDGNNYLLHFNPIDGPNNAVPFQDLSFGTQRLVSLVTALIHDRATVSLIEQPEDGIHPGLLYKLMSLLRTYSSQSQFVMASHAPTVLNSANPEELRIVHRMDGVTAAVKLTDAQIASARAFLNDSGPLFDFVDSL